MSDPLKQGRIVYFLGAGASRSICGWLPLASDLTLGKLANIEEYSNQMPPKPEASRLAEFLSGWGDAQKYRDLPLEESLRVLKSGYPEEFGLAHYCLAMRLSVDNYEHRSFGEFEKWLDSVRIHRDVIITTNYDTLIEQANAYMPPSSFGNCLHALDFGVRVQKTHKFSYANQWGGAAESSVLFLKLHGSVSWLFCQNKNCNNYALDPTWDYAVDSIARPRAYPPCPECKEKGTRRPVLVSPLKQKELKDAAIKEIWNVAQTALREADEIVFAGFSLNKNDDAVRNLLTTGFRQDVTVVDPNAALIKENYVSVYGEIVQFATTTWKDFLEEHFCSDGPQTEASQSKSGFLRIQA